MKISNRELLRNYKSLKNKLVSGETEEILIPQSSGVILKLTVQRLAKKNSIDRFLEVTKGYSFRGLKRPKEDII
mgnify:CR=1